MYMNLEIYTQIYVTCNLVFISMKKKSWLASRMNSTVPVHADSGKQAQNRRSVPSPAPK